MSRSRRKNQIRTKAVNNASRSLFEQSATTNHQTGSFISIPNPIKKDKTSADSNETIIAGGHLPKELADQAIDQAEVIANLHTEYIVISADRAKLHIKEYDQAKSKHSNAKCGLITYAGLLFTLLTTFASTDFKDNILKSSTWEAMYVMACFISLFLVIKNLVKVIKNKDISEIDLIGKLKTHHN